MKQPLLHGLLFLSLLTGGSFARAQNLPEVPLDQAWKDKIHALAPAKARFPSAGKKRILVFSLHTGFKHWVIPHAEEMVRILGAKSGAFEVAASKDIAEFEAANLKRYHAVVLNNTCSKGDYRDLFLDVLRERAQGGIDVQKEQAARLEKNLIQYVENGGGLFVFHGGVVTQNNSMDFSRMLGASFDYHPPQQRFTVRVEDPRHPLTAAFTAGEFSHVDEPYFYKNAYEALNFRPLLSFSNAEIQKQRQGQEKTAGRTYVAWIRAHGRGKVMYASPSHNAQSFENPQLLQFFLDGMQYVVGDVKCDDSPLRPGT
jgi:type 1 glutamine amidotransferase